MPGELGSSRETPLVEARAVGVSFAGLTVLSDVDLSVRPGEIVTLIGPNGAGKTTLVRVLLGLQRPQRGRVLRRQGLSLAYVPQRFAIDPTLPLTVARFLALPRRHARREVDAALSEVGVAHLAKSALHRLSGGEFQRVMLARALLRAPDLLVLDEPLQGVDFTGQIALFELVARLRREHGYAVLMVSHDLHLVMRATDRVICLNHHVCCHGEPEEVSRHPAYTELFGPAAARALAVYSHAHDHAHDLAGEVVTADEGEPGDSGREGAA